jgi:hypothetical protein
LSQSQSFDGSREASVNEQPCGCSPHPSSDVRPESREASPKSNYP